MRVETQAPASSPPPKSNGHDTPTGRTRRIFTKDQRKDYVARFKALGKDVTLSVGARTLGINDSVLRRWIIEFAPSTAKKFAKKAPAKKGPSLVELRNRKRRERAAKKAANNARYRDKQKAAVQVVTAEPVNGAKLNATVCLHQYRDTARKMIVAGTLQVDDPLLTLAMLALNTSMGKL